MQLRLITGEHGADVKAGRGVYTALHGAAQLGRPEMAGWLIAHGAEVEAKDFEGKTPLARAIEYGQSDVAELLRRHGATE